MPRVYTQKAGKDYPAHGIKKGQTYYQWSFFRGATLRSATAPRPSQLTQQEGLSAAYAAVEGLQDTLKEAKTVADVKGALDDAYGALEEALGTVQESVDNLEDAFPNGCPALEEKQAQVEAIESLQQEIEEVQSELDEEEYEDEGRRNDAFSSALEAAEALELSV